MRKACGAAICLIMLLVSRESVGMPFCPEPGAGASIISIFKGACTECDRGPADTCGQEFSITLVDVAPGPLPTSVTYTYEVYKSPDILVGTDLAYWVLGVDLAEFQQYLDAGLTLSDIFVDCSVGGAQGSGCMIVTPDSATQLAGVKFQGVVGDGQTVTFSVTLDEAALIPGYGFGEGCVLAATKAGIEDIRRTDRPAPGYVCISGPAIRERPIICPVARAGADQDVCIDDTVQLNGCASYDPDGWPITYSWSILSKPACSTVVLSDRTVCNPTFTADCAGDFVFRLIVNDSECNSNPDTVLVSVRDCDPVAEAGPDQKACIDKVVRLNGCASYDPDGRPITYSWSILNKPACSTAVLSDRTVCNPTFTADCAGDFVFRLIVNDGEFESEPDTVLVSVADCVPVAEAGPDQTADIGEVVQLNGCASYDPNGRPLTYSWSILDKPACSTAVLSSKTLCNPTFTADCAGDFVFRLIVSNGKFESEPDTVLVKVAHCEEYVCPKGQGYWKNHVNKWPVDSLTLGCQEYSQEELLTGLKTPPRGDASLILAKQLIAAKLNIENCSDPEPVYAVIDAADQLLCEFPGKLPYRVRTYTRQGKKMIKQARILDAYNNGWLTDGCGNE